MAVLPLADVVGNEEVRCSGQYHQQDQKAAQAAEQQQIYGKAAEVCQQLGQRSPNMLCRIVVAAGGPLRLLLQLENFGVVDIWIGGLAAFPGHHADDGTAHINLAGHTDGLAVRRRPLQKEQHRRKEPDGLQQLPHGRALLHLYQNFRRDIQLRQIQRHLNGRKHNAKQQHLSALFPCGAHHKADILPDAVLRFLCVFHVVSPHKSSIAEKIVPG